MPKGREEGSGNGAPERPEAPANVSGGWSSGQDLGLCRAAGPPPRGISTRPFPRPASHSPSGHLLCPWGTLLPAPSNQAHLAAGSQGLAHRSLLLGAPLNQVKGWGARGVGKQGSDFLPLTLLFDPLLERLIYRNQWFHRGLLSGFCCFQDA